MTQDVQDAVIQFIKQKIGTSKSLGVTWYGGEPTLALDSQSKKQLVYYINATKKSKIYIIVSHDQEILSCCDYLIDCQGGSIAE